MLGVGRLGEWLLFLLILVYAPVRAQAILADSLRVSQNSEISGEHLVQPGDTYYRLAKIYQVPVDSLTSWNGQNLLVGKIIQVKLKLPGQPTADTVSTFSHKPIKKPARNSPGPVPTLTPEPAQPISTTITHYDNPENAGALDKTVPRIIVIPFDPHLYFSDADEDIARQSRIPRQNVRYTFRTRLSALVIPSGFETINLLNNGSNQSSYELPDLYQSLTYQYQSVKVSRFNPGPPKQPALITGPKAWFQKTKRKSRLSNYIPRS